MCIKEFEKYCFVKYLKTTLFTILILLASSHAHADFRKALAAYQVRDGKTMLEEMQTAVNEKNSDGFELFVSVLETDSWLASSSEFTLSPVGKLLSKQQLNNFVRILKYYSATNQNPSTLERLLNYLRMSNAIEHKEISAMYGSEIFKKAYFSGSITNKSIGEAVSYLLGYSGNNRKNSIEKNEAKGLRLLKEALSRPDAYLYWGGYSHAISQYYYDKYLQNKNISFLRQAHAWGVLGYTHKNFFKGYLVDQSPEAIKEMQKNRLLIKVAPELDAALSIPYKPSDKESIELRAKAIWQSIDNVEMPILIRNNHKTDLNNQPVISLTRINYDTWQSMMGDEYMTGAGTSILNFSIEIYKDGRVMYLQGFKGMPMFGHAKNVDVLMKISPQEVDELQSKIMNLTSKAPLVSIGMQEYRYCRIRESCGTAEYEISFTQNYAVSVHHGEKYRTVKYLGSNLTPTFARIFRMMEERIGTAQYRCGTDQLNDYYQYCINKDNEIFNVANSNR